MTLFLPAEVAAWPSNGHERDSGRNVPVVNNLNVALLFTRVYFGLAFAYHGYNKCFGPSGLKGTTGWFASLGLKWPHWQARIAATTEISCGIMLAVGLATPFAASGMIATMIVAIVLTHWKVGFFIFKKGEGWEYCASIAVTALAIATIGSGKYSIDHLLHKDVQNWTGLVIALALGVGGAVLQLTVSREKS